MNTKNKGDISEAIIAAEILKCGFSVSKPFGDNQPYDLIIDLHGELKKIQIKTARIKNKCVIFHACNSINTYLEKNKRSQSYKGKVDYIAAYCPDNDSCYIIPIQNCPETLVSLRLELPKNNQLKGIKFAYNYLLVNSLSVKAPS